MNQVSLSQPGGKIETGTNNSNNKCRPKLVQGLPQDIVINFHLNNIYGFVAQWIKSWRTPVWFTDREKIFSLEFLLKRKWTKWWTTRRTTQVIPWSLADGHRQKESSPKNVLIWAEFKNSLELKCFVLSEVRVVGVYKAWIQSPDDDRVRSHDFVMFWTIADMENDNKFWLRPHRWWRKKIERLFKRACDEFDETWNLFSFKKTCEVFQRGFHSTCSVFKTKRKMVNLTIRPSGPQ